MMGRPEQNLYDRLKRKLDAYRPELGVVLSMYAQENPEVKKREAFRGNDASAELILYLSETLLAIEQLRAEIETVVFEQQENGERIDPKMTRLMGDLMQLEPLALRTAIVGVEMHGVIWDVSHKPPAKADAWKARRDKELREIHEGVTRKREAQGQPSPPDAEDPPRPGPPARAWKVR